MTQEFVNDAQSAAQRVTEIRLPIYKGMEVTKNGLEIGTMQVIPTKISASLNDESYGNYYGFTLTYKF